MDSPQEIKYSNIDDAVSFWGGPHECNWSFQRFRFGIAFAFGQFGMKYASVLIFCLVLVGARWTVAWGIVLGWTTNSSVAVKGYNVYYGTNSGKYPYKINAGNKTTAEISNLIAGATYYFAATAYDTNGNESPYSSEVSFVVPGILTAIHGTTSTQPALLQFPVAPGHWYEIQATTNLHSWASIWQSSVEVSNVWAQFSDLSATSSRYRFYRLVQH